MFLILIDSPYTIQVESFALHIYVACVGLNCQLKTKKMPGGI